MKAALLRILFTSTLTIFTFPAFSNDQEYKLVTLPDQKVSNVVDILDSAKSSLKLFMFHLSQPDLINEIVELGKRGVHVQIILDKNILSGPSAQAIYQKIITGPGSKNIEIKPSSSGFSITHTKAMLIDDSTLFVSSINFSNAIAWSRDFGLIWKNPEDIQEFNSVFDNDWKLSGTNLNTTPPLLSPRLVWSPVNSKSRIEALIKEAKTSLDIEVENLGSADIQNSITEAIERGVAVKLVMSLCTEGQAERNWPFITQLVNAGASARVMPETKDNEHPYIHAKLILVDGKSFYLGSENFSENSLDHAREVGVVLDSISATKELTDTFMQDWEHATDWSSVNKSCSLTIQQ